MPPRSAASRGPTIIGPESRGEAEVPARSSFIPVIAWLNLDRTPHEDLLCQEKVIQFLLQVSRAARPPFPRPRASILAEDFLITLFPDQPKPGLTRLSGPMI